MRQAMTTMSMPIPVRDCVRRFIARQRLLALVRAIGLAAAFAIAFGIAACLADRLLRLPAPIRIVLLAAG